MINYKKSKSTLIIENAFVKRGPCTLFCGTPDLI